MSKQKKAVILGAGAAGLVSAWKLLENGWSVDVYEKDSIIGGTCKTWKWGDFLVDTGPHIFHTPDKKLAEFWESEFGDLFIRGDFWCKNVKGKQFSEYFDYPLSWESISRYPKSLKEKILTELDNLKTEQKVRAKNYTEYMEAQVGPTLREMFFTKYPEKVWGIQTEEMAADWAPKRIEFRQKVTPFYHKQWNAVGTQGTGCVFERIKEKIKSLGGRIYTNHTVSKVVTNNTVIKKINFNEDAEISVDTDDIVISTIPITLMASLLGYTSKLKYRSLRTVYLAYNKKQVLPEGIHWLYYDSDEVYFHRVTEAKKLSPLVAPEKKTYISAEITTSKGDAIDLMNDKLLMKKVSEQIELVGLAKKTDLIDSALHREDYAYPLQNRGYQDELSKTKAEITKYQQLYSIGTGGEFHYSDIQIIFYKAFDLIQTLCGKDSSFSQTIRQTQRCNLNKQVYIGNKSIGNGSRPYIIAEAGLNHNGSLTMAKQLVDAAEAAGCDAVKFQTFKASSRISQKVKSVRYAETIIGTEETLYDMFDRLSMNYEDQKELFKYAEDIGIEIFSTPFDLESVDFLESLRVKAYKIASMDLVNLELIRYVAKQGKPIIISTGMSTLGQVEEAVEAVLQECNPNLILLHCNSSYPAAVGEMNLNVINSLKKSFGVPVGLSDHTLGLLVSQTALSIGADVIERHFTLDRMLEGPDHILSSEPKDFAKLVNMAQTIPTLLGDGIKRIQPNEYDTLNTQRKSIYAATTIKKGSVVTKDMIAIKGPGGGLLPKYADIIVGKIARNTIEEDYPITWEDF